MKIFVKNKKSLETAREQIKRWAKAAGYPYEGMTWRRMNHEDTGHSVFYVGVDLDKHGFRTRNLGRIRCINSNLGDAVETILENA